MPFNINEFHSEMAKRGGPAKQSNFDVLNITEFLCILSVSSKYMVTIK